LTTYIQRPQPVCIFPPPAEFLVLPQANDTGALAALLRGEIGQPLPPAWQFFEAAAQGQIARAVEMLAGVETPVARYNLFVLRGATLADYRKLRDDLFGGLAPLLELVAFKFGLVDELPAPESLDGELKAALLLSRASLHLESHDATLAIANLQEAVACVRTISPVFAAQLLGQIAGLQSNTPGQDAGRTIGNYRDAIQLAGNTPLDGLRAELWLNLGSCYQEHSDGRRDYLTQAMQAYQQAVQCGLSENNHPEMYALAQNNLGLAYLSMPIVEANDGLRKAIAVQSFREALKVYQADTHRLEWVSAKLNLANALQHLPSFHPEENLLQAAEIYEELLQTRSRAEDPVGYARLLANQANALAHLGLFSQSLEKANEAYKLFHWHNETDSANSVLQLVASVHENLGNKQVTA
jgi:tetratricopeptide (TPR) repeat protein